MAVIMGKRYRHPPKRLSIIKKVIISLQPILQLWRKLLGQILATWSVLNLFVFVCLLEQSLPFTIMHECKRMLLLQ